MSGPTCYRPPPETLSANAERAKLSDVAGLENLSGKGSPLKDGMTIVFFTANAVDITSFYYDGTNYFGQYSVGFA